jgi:hypothetical protein
VMLGEIAFDHPLFAPFAGAQYNDFTKVRFWKYRRLDEASLADSRVVARFENRDPAVLEKSLGRGRLVVLTSGWTPEDSQLARSSKFVPFMATLVGEDASAALADLTIGQPVTLPADDEGAVAIQKPDGGRVVLADGTERFAGTDQPGVYTVEGAAAPATFAVNIDPAESRTSPLAAEALEQLGCRLADRSAETPAEAAERRRQMLNAELEARQKLWRWLILAAVGVLIVETWLSGRLPRAGAAQEAVAA